MTAWEHLLELEFRGKPQALHERLVYYMGYMPRTMRPEERGGVQRRLIQDCVVSNKKEALQQLLTSRMVSLEDSEQRFLIRYDPGQFTNKPKALQALLAQGSLSNAVWDDLLALDARQFTNKREAVRDRVKFAMHQIHSQGVQLKILALPEDEFADKIHAVSFVLNQNSTTLYYQEVRRELERMIRAIHTPRHSILRLLPRQVRPDR
jgi:hypothetical protein